MQRKHGFRRNTKMVMPGTVGSCLPPLIWRDKGFTEVKSTEASLWSMCDADIPTPHALRRNGVGGEGRKASPELLNILAAAMALTALADAAALGQMAARNNLENAGFSGDPPWGLLLATSVRVALPIIGGGSLFRAGAMGCEPPMLSDRQLCHKRTTSRVAFILFFGIV